MVMMFSIFQSDVIKSTDIPRNNSISTSTDDLTVSCANCKTTYFNPSIVNNEVELCAELHKVIADSLSINKRPTRAPEHPEKIDGRTRRRRSQAFYHEMDDSICSSMTEFTNTEGSQCYEEEYASEMDSYESETEDSNERAKRFKPDPEVTENENVQHDFILKVVPNTEILKEVFKSQVECRYYPLSLMSLALNVINKENIPDYEPDDFYVKTFEPQCRYCRQTFKNSQLLALHEIDHINIELGEKVDNPVPWHESRDDADVRNKWLIKYDEEIVEMYEAEEEPVEFMDCDDDVADDSLLIPVSSEGPEILRNNEEEIVLVLAEPVVNGKPLQQYSKEQRKSFYKSMKIGNVNKKFCSLCRYIFKDNWAIESHYFSLACYYTCRYCGMRYNKQRQHFDEHVSEHESKGDKISNKFYASSKLSNFMPRVIQIEKAKNAIAQHNNDENKVRPKSKLMPQRKSLPPNIKIKEEKIEEDEIPPKLLQKKPNADVVAPIGSPTKATNQAYFCRKCYKVFFKLDEFNMHSKNCDYNQFPQFRSNNGEVVQMSPAGRPIRHCVKETGPYRDEAFVSEKDVSPSQQNCICFICNTPFPTVYSRNSHMRIHKNDKQKTQPPKQNNVKSDSIPSYLNYIKREPLEPEVKFQICILGIFKKIMHRVCFLLTKLKVGLR